MCTGPTVVKVGWASPALYKLRRHVLATLSKLNEEHWRVERRHASTQSSNEAEIVALAAESTSEISKARLTRFLKTGSYGASAQGASG